MDDTTIDEEETDETGNMAKTNYGIKNLPTSQNGHNERLKCKFNAQSRINEHQFHKNFSQSLPSQCAALPCATCFRIIKSCHSSSPREDNEVLWSPRHNEIRLVNIDDELEENYYKPPVEFCDCRKSNDKQRGDQLDLEYNEKKNLIDAVLRSCNDFVDFLLSKTNEEASKCKYNDSYLMGKFSLSIQQLLMDGLLPSRNLCNVIYYSSMLCSIPNSVRTLAENMQEELVKNTKMNVDFVFQLFVTGLLKLRNLDTYLLHLVTERRFLSHYYSPKSFLLNASSIYKPLLEKFLSSIRPLTLLNFTPLSPCSLLAQIAKSSIPFSATLANNNFNPAKLPPDSRIPKSSSLPSKMNDRTSMIDNDNFGQSYPLVKNPKFFADDSGDEENEFISTMMSTDDSADESSDCD
uniref:RUN domain-containing protein n=1 Tax=Romanomermis culicivorax TaxID=13658 RepID=A0A915IIP9_ROMCU